MTEFLDLFAQMPAWQKLAWVVFCLSLAWIVEAIAPLAKHDYGKLKHDGTNLVFLSFSLFINFIVGAATVGVFLWIENANVGLLQSVDLPLLVELSVAVLCLDLMAQYTVHYLLHRVTWMWKLHMVHHSDTRVDATTGTRHHPGDYLLREVFALTTAVVIGIPVAFYVFYRILTIFFAYFTHANFSLPQGLDRALSWVLITPNMHKFHHHFERPWTDTNFGNIFSFWDRLFGTLVYDDPRKVRYGLDVLDDRLDEDIVYQLRIPWDNTIRTGTRPQTAPSL